MLTTLQFISLRTVKYDDKRAIVTAWSRSHGRLSLLTAAGATREAARRRALLMPLSLFEGVADLRPDREIYPLREVRPLRVLAHIHAHPLKAVMSLFVADFLEWALRTSPPDQHLTDFLFESVALLDSLRDATAVANFHLYLLDHLGRFLGIEPDIGSRMADTDVFDMRDGVFRASAPMHSRYHAGSRARAVWLLSRMRPQTLAAFRFTRAERNDILDEILAYYSMHLSPVGALPSLAIVRDVMC